MKKMLKSLNDLKIALTEKTGKFHGFELLFAVTEEEFVLTPPRGFSIKDHAKMVIAGFYGKTPEQAYKRMIEYLQQQDTKLFFECSEDGYQFHATVAYKNNAWIVEYASVGHSDIPTIYVD